MAHFRGSGEADVVVFAFRVLSLGHRHEGAVFAVTNLNAANGKAAAERHAGCRQQVFAVLHGKDLYGHVHRAGVIFIQVGFLLSLMCCEDAPRHAAGFEQRKAEQDRVAHTRPDGLGYILVERYVLHQHGVDGHTDDDEEGLEREGKEASEVVLPHAAPLAAHHRRHGYGG